MTITLWGDLPPDAPIPGCRNLAGATMAGEAAMAMGATGPTERLEAGLWLEIERSKRLRAACEALLQDRPFTEAPAAPLCETVSVRRAPQSAWVRLRRWWPKVTGSGSTETAAFVRGC